MAISGKEKEAKFYVLDLQQAEARLRALGAVCTRDRHHEYNLRFDTPDRALGQVYRALRLRQDTEVTITYKGPSEDEEGVHVRREIEFGASDFEAAQALLEELGYEVSVIYEKYRTTYLHGDNLVTLDEMPFGDFVEIEGPSGEKIRALAEALDLDWEARILASYLNLFDRLQASLDLKFRDLIFDHFVDLRVSAAAFSARPADTRPD